MDSRYIARFTHNARPPMPRLIHLGSITSERRILQKRLDEDSVGMRTHYCIGEVTRRGVRYCCEKCGREALCEETRYTRLSGSLDEILRSDGLCCIGFGAATSWVPSRRFVERINATTNTR